MKTFRLFISSTFNDFKNERETLHKEVFPEIKEYARDKGFEFQPIDLRWGVSDESQLDQKALELCLEEVKACKSNPYPNFLIMVGDRYGWVPLPYMIEKDEFEEIRDKIEDVGDKELLDFWYKLDSNQIPPSYILQPRERGSKYANYEEWVKVECALRDTLQKAVDTLGYEGEKKDKYFLSATEQEAIEGVCDYKKLTASQENSDACKDREIDKKHIYCYMRGADTNLSKDIKRLRDGLRDSLHKDNIITKNLKDEIVDKLKHSIDSHIDNIKQEDPQELEKQEHLRFKSIKTKTFFGREEELKKIYDYIATTSDKPFLIHGSSGMGKSALMAKAIDDNELERDIIYRFVGISPDSTSVVELLKSIITQAFKGGYLNKPEGFSFEYDENRFFTQVKELLSDTNNFQKPLTIFIDSLDQLHSSQTISWLPDTHENLKLVLSTLDTEPHDFYYKQLQYRCQTLKLEGIDESSAKKSAVSLLKDYNRTLQDTQIEYLLSKAKKADLSPLYIALSIEELRHWSSEYQPKDNDLSESLEGVICEFIENLYSIFHHSKILVEKVLGYICASKDGLSESELLQILGEDLNDEESFRKEILNEFHTPVTEYNPRRGKEELILPASIWSRLHTQLKPFIITKKVDDIELINFFHRKIEEVVRKEIYEPNKKTLHTKLSDYFYSIQDDSKSWQDRYYSPHMTSELPYQLYHAGKSKELQEILTDLEFAGAVYDYKKHDGFIDILNKSNLEDEVANLKPFFNNFSYYFANVAFAAKNKLLLASSISHISSVKGDFGDFDFKFQISASEKYKFQGIERTFILKEFPSQPKPKLKTAATDDGGAIFYVFDQHLYCIDIKKSKGTEPHIIEILPHDDINAKTIDIGSYGEFVYALYAITEYPEEDPEYGTIGEKFVFYKALKYNYKSKELKCSDWGYDTDFNSLNIYNDIIIVSNEDMAVSFDFELQKVDFNKVLELHNNKYFANYSDSFISLYNDYSTILPQFIKSYEWKSTTKQHTLRILVSTDRFMLCQFEDEFYGDTENEMILFDKEEESAILRDIGQYYLTENSFFNCLCKNGKFYEVSDNGIEAKFDSISRTSHLQSSLDKTILSLNKDNFIVELNTDDAKCIEVVDVGKLYDALNKKFEKSKNLRSKCEFCFHLAYKSSSEKWILPSYVRKSKIVVDEPTEDYPFSTQEEITVSIEYFDISISNNGKIDILRVD
ncbi:MAG: AAA family ATPase, partial [Campylobacterales bacterium]